MLAFACLFATAAVIGSLFGLEAIEYSPGGHHIAHYGWALCINAAAISALLTFNLYQRHRSRIH
jgi:hypothetical protein